MAARDAVQNVRFKHGVEGDPAQFNAVVLQNAAVVLEVLPNLKRLFIFQNRLQQLKHAFTGDLFRRVQVIVRHGNIGRMTWLCRK